MCIFTVFPSTGRMHKAEVVCGFAQKLFMFAYPCHPCVVYLPTFTKENNHMHVNIPHVDGMGMYGICLLMFFLDFDLILSCHITAAHFFWPKRLQPFFQQLLFKQQKQPNLTQPIFDNVTNPVHFVAMVGRSGNVRRFKPALATIFVLPLLHLAMSFSFTFVGASWKVRNRQQIRVRAEPDTSTEAWKEPGLFWVKGKGWYC